MLLDGLKNKIDFVPYINTGTIFDLATGKFQLGINNKWYLNGGLGLILGVSGRPQTYKSAIAGSLMARTMLNYPDITASVYETEFTIPDADRYDDFVPTKVSDRIAFNNRTSMNLGDYFEHLKEICEIKMKNKKDLVVESPFINPMTGKRHRIWVPTIALCDSWSKAGSAKEDDLYSKNKVDDSAMNMLYMQEGGVKTRIMRALPTMASKYGIYMIMTAHVGNKTDLDPYNKTPKQLQYMKGSDKMKNVGAEFDFLTTTLLQTTGATVLMSSDKKSSLYPINHSPINEINEVGGVMVRCKNNAAGAVLPYIVSQYQSILNEVTNFHLCDKRDDFGLTASGRSDYSPFLKPDVILNRTNIRQKTQGDYEVCRALELTAQLCFIQNYWATFNMPEWVRMPIKKVAELLTKNNKPAISDILNSTGVWNYQKTDREYYSIFDVLELLSKQK